MRIDGVFHVKGRGLIATGTWTNGALSVGGTVRRVSDGAEWRVRAIDRFALYIGRPFSNEASRRCGLLLDGDAEPEIGDEIVVT